MQPSTGTDTGLGPKGRRMARIAPAILLHSPHPCGSDRRLRREQGIARRWSPWSGEERRVPEGQVVERSFLSSLSFARPKERDLQLDMDVN